MGYLRFYRRKQIFPGLRLNFSKRGVSASVGVRGAHVTLGRTRRRRARHRAVLHLTGSREAWPHRCQAARHPARLVRGPMEEGAAALLGRQQVDGLQQRLGRNVG
jgi:hypothetical protein